LFNNNIPAQTPKITNTNGNLNTVSGSLFGNIGNVSGGSLFGNLVAPS